MAKHVKLFEGWLSDVAQLFTGVAAKSSFGSDNTEFKEFEGDIEDLSDTAHQSSLRPMKKKEKYFVVHHTAGRGKAEDVVDILNNRNLGVQWVIDREGKVFRTFPEGLTAWHAGTAKKDRKPGAPSDLENDTAQGVEVIASNDSDVLPVQVLAAFKLMKWLGFDKGDVWGHGEITFNKEATEGKTIVDFWRTHSEKSIADVEKMFTDDNWTVDNTKLPVHQG
jgi:N-acetyl-anhydromuramyl-L-alanine amidase AmpD